jgi:hypothetical protein
MGGVQRTRLAAEKALGEIVGVPQIEVADLRPLGADDPEEMAGRHVEGPRVARRHDRFGDLGQVAPDEFVEGPIVGRQLVRRVADDRRRGPALGCVGRSLSLRMSSHSVAFGRSVDIRTGIAMFA